MLSTKINLYICSLNKKMNRLRQTGLVFLVILVLISTTGFTIYDHICACKPVAVAVQQHSCCHREVPAPVALTDNCGTGCANNHKGCKDVPLFFRATIIAVPAAHKLLLPQVLPVLVTELPYGEFTETLVEKTLDIYRPESPPPRAGRILVNYLHQIKIPFVA